MTAARRPLETWLLPAVLCADRVPHPPHDCPDDEDDLGGPVWCRGRMPFTLESARAGAQLATTMRQITAWQDMCSRTPAGRRFLESRDWRERAADVYAAEQLARVERKAMPLWRRLLGWTD